MANMKRHGKSFHEVCRASSPSVSSSCIIEATIPLDFLLKKTHTFFFASRLAYYRRSNGDFVIISMVFAIPFGGVKPLRSHVFSHATEWFDQVSNRINGLLQCCSHKTTTTAAKPKDRTKL